MTGVAAISELDRPFSRPREGDAAVPVFPAPDGGAEFRDAGVAGDEIEIVPADRGVLAEPVDRFESGVDIEDPAVQVDHDDGFRGQFDGRPEAEPLLVGQRLAQGLRLLALGDVVDHPDGADDPAGGVPDVLAFLVDDPDLAGVPAHDPVLDLVAVAVLHAANPDKPRRRPCDRPGGPRPERPRRSRRIPGARARRSGRSRPTRSAGRRRRRAPSCRGGRSPGTSRADARSRGGPPRPFSAE